jgi:hypothetical protein
MLALAVCAAYGRRASMWAGLTAVELGVGLTRSPSPFHAGRKRLISKACCRVSMW